MDAWSLFIKPLSMQLWAALTLHSLILIVILRILWWHYDRKMPGVNNASIVECGFKTIQYYVMLCAAYLGNGYAQMPHNRQFVTKGKSFMVFLHFGEKCYLATSFHFLFHTKNLVSKLKRRVYSAKVM